NLARSASASTWKPTSSMATASTLTCSTMSSMRSTSTLMAFPQSLQGPHRPRCVPRRPRCGLRKLCAAHIGLDAVPIDLDATSVDLDAVPANLTRTALMRRIPPQQHQGLVVPLRQPARELADRAGDGGQHIGQRLVALPAEEVDQPAHAELLFVGRLGLGDAVAVDAEQVARLHRHGAGLEARLGEEAQRQAAGTELLDCVVAAQQDAGVVAGVHVV